MRSSFKFCWMWIFPWIRLSWLFSSMWDKLGWFNWFWQFLCEGLFSFNWKGFCYSYAWSFNLCEKRLPFAWDLSLENSADSYLSFQLALLHSLSYFFFLYWSPSSSLCTVFGSVSTNIANIDEVLSINSSTNLSVFVDFNICHKDWLTYSGGTDRPGELCYIFSISNDLTQIVNFNTWIPDCDSHSHALWIYSFLLMLVFVLQWLFLHWEILIMFSQFPSTNSKWYALFHCIAYDYSCADWDGLCDHLRDVPWEYIFKLSASASVSEFCEWVQVRIDLYIPEVSGQTSLICVVFNCLCCCHSS